VVCWPCRERHHVEESHISGAAREVQVARCARLEDRWVGMEPMLVTISTLGA
jgi:hypothetical protein